MLQARDHAQDARLLAEFQMILETHQVEAGGPQVFLAQLDHRPRTASGARIGEAHRLHGAEAQCVAPAPRQLFDRQARLEEGRPLLVDVRRDALRLQQFVDEAFVLLAVERTVQVVVGSVGRLAVARGPECEAGIDRIGFDDGADAVEEEQAVRACEPRDLLRQGVAGERAGSDHDYGVLGNGRDFFAPQFDTRLGRNGPGDFGSEDLTVDRERVAARNAGLAGRIEQQRIEPAQFFLEQPRRRVFLLGFE